MSNNPKLATEQQVQDVSNTFAELFNHQGKQIKALESGVIDAIEPSSPAPTKRGEYKVTKPGIYLNFKDGNGQPISVTEEDYSSGNVSIIFNGTDNRKLVVPITFEGEVKEGDTRGVSGGIVYDTIGSILDLTGSNLFIFKSANINSNGILITSNELLECTNFIDISNLDILKGKGRGGLQTPIITYYDKDKVRLDAIFSNSVQQSFIIKRENFPSGAKFVRINSLINEGELLVPIDNRITTIENSITQKLTFSLNEGYVSNEGVLIPANDWKSTGLIPITQMSNINVYNAATNGKLVQPVCLFDNKKGFIKTIGNFQNANNFQNLKIDSENISPNACFMIINTRSYSGMYIETNIGDTLVRLSDFENYGFVQKEAGKGLSDNNFSTTDKIKVDKIRYDGTGHKVLFDDGKYKDISNGETVDPVPLKIENIVTKQITTARVEKFKSAKLVLTFDDSRTGNFSHVKPILDRYGVKASFYVNELDEEGEMTSEEVILLNREGHEFGGHTQWHTMMGGTKGEGVANIGQQILKITAPSGAGGGAKRYFYMGSDSSWWFYALLSNGQRKDFEVISTEYKDNYWWLTLSKPLEWSAESYTVYVSEKTIIESNLRIKNKLNDLGIDCIGMAYPYGGANFQAEQSMQSIFNYARGATATKSIFKIFGGKDSRGYIDKFNQFRIPCIELIELTDLEIENYLKDSINKNGVCVFLGHAVIDSNHKLYQKLRFTIEKAQQLGIEITTLRDALDTHGNLQDFGGYSINSEGIPQGNGLSVLAPNTIALEDNSDIYPSGIAIQRVYANESDGYPGEGTRIMINSGYRGISKTDWVVEYFIEKKNRNIWYRRKITGVTSTPWECLINRTGVNFPTIGLFQGTSFFRTDLKKNFWYDGENWIDAYGNVEI